MKNYFFSVVICLLLCRTSFSQQGIFNNVPSNEDRWPVNVVFAQDPQGYMWFGSNKGIHRYNGSTTVTYRHEAGNPNSLTDGSVECLFIDGKGIIWVGTLGSGLDRFDPARNLFTHFHYKEGNPDSLANDTVTCITQDKQGALWIGTHEGLDRLDPKTGKFSHYANDANDPSSLSDNKVRAVYVDLQDVLWVGTGSPFRDDGGKKTDGGLNRLDRNTNKFTRYMHSGGDPFSLVDNRVGAIYEDSRGTFWVGTAGDGLHTLNRATGKFERHQYDPLDPGKLSCNPVRTTFDWVDDHITFIKEDAAGFLWIGTMMGGLTRYDFETHKVLRYGVLKDASRSFPDSSAWSAYSSRDGSFWVSTWQQHVFRVNPFQNNFTYQNTGEEAVGVYKNPDGGSWVFTKTALIKMDTRDKISEKIFINKDHQRAIQTSLDFFREVDGNFWIATDKGLLNFDPQKGKFTWFTHKDSDKKSISSNVIFSICHDRNSNLWIGTQNGLNKMDRKNGEFLCYRDTTRNKDLVARNYINNLIAAGKDSLWVGTGAGLKLFDTKSGRAKNYLKGIVVYSVFKDAAGSVWVGGPDGLFRFDTAHDNFIPFPDPISGLSFKNVSGIVEDNQKELWFNATPVPCRLNPQRDSCRAFDNIFGLKNINSGGLIANGLPAELFLCDSAGYYDVPLGDVTGNFTPPQIAITTFSLGKQVILAGNRLLPGGISNASEIDLNYKQNYFSFEFDVLHFTDASKNQCLFKLENYDTKWKQAGPDRTASYFNVPPGHYVFKVKAASASGIWSEKEIEVVVNPPWWQTWWAYTLFALVLIGITSGVIYYRSRQLRFENRRLEEKVRLRTHQLQQEKEKVESTLTELRAAQTQLIQSEKMASLGELTAGIAHEIQNPLNFVNNFSEVNRELIDEMQREMDTGNLAEARTISNSIKDNEEKITSHGRRADAIVKGMLQHSRASAGQKEPTDINKLADEYLRLAYHGLRAKDKSFNAAIKTEFDTAIGEVNIVPQDIGRVILNLINNAFYAVGERRKAEGVGYEPTVVVSTKKAGPNVFISVKDNGNGIPQSIVEKIFQPFFTTKPTGQGTGLGLSLAYDIVKAHGGEIKVNTKEGEGSEFIISL